MSSGLRRFARFTLTVALIVALPSVFWTYRVRAAATEAASYQPTDVRPMEVPAGTAIEAELKNQIIARGVGDAIMATVSEPVVLDGRTVIPPGAQLTGRLESLSKHHHHAEAVIDFTTLHIADREIPVRMQPVTLNTHVGDEMDVLSYASKTLAATSIGASIGAASGDLRLVRRGMMEALNSLPTFENVIPVRVTLARDLEV